MLNECALARARNKQIVLGQEKAAWTGLNAENYFRIEHQKEMKNNYKFILS